jgi:hypothetical protein
MGIPVYWSLTIPPPSESKLKPTLKQTRPTPSSIRRHAHTNILRRPLYSEIVRHPPDDDGTIASFFPQRQPPPARQRRESEREGDRPQPSGRHPAEYRRPAGRSVMHDFMANHPYTTTDGEINWQANSSADVNNELETLFDSVPAIGDARSLLAIPNDTEESRQSRRHDRIGYVSRLLRENNMGPIDNPETRSGMRPFLNVPQVHARGPTAPPTESTSPTNTTAPASTEVRSNFSVEQYISWMSDPALSDPAIRLARLATLRASVPSEQTGIVQRSPEPIPMSESSYESTMFDDDSEDERAMTLRLRELADRRLEELHMRQARERGPGEARPRPIWVVPEDLYRTDEDDEDDDYSDEERISGSFGEQLGFL